MTSTLGHGFLTVPPTTRERQHLYDNDVHEVGYVMNLSLLWAQLPDAKVTWESLLMLAVETAGLTFRQRALLVSACAATLGDAYCSLAWGNRLAGTSDPALAAAVVIGDDSRLGHDERVLTSWARAITRDPNSTTRRDVQALRDAGYSEQQIFAITLFVALRIAFSTVNDALGAAPDRELIDAVAPALRNAVTFGRQP